ncbi:MAG: BMP family ABC transporter substrate-binding protein [Treponema sp.]|nr:BMP family ABC transporter substrate-binding protein [Treponema sp.]
MMKLIIKTMLIALAGLAFVSCGKKEETAKSTESKEATTYRVAMVTDSGDITDQSFNQTTYQACKLFSDTNKLEFKYYKPAGDSTADRVASINAAIQDDYNVIVLPGYLFAEAIVKTAEDNSDVTFVGLDIGEGDLTGAATAAGKENWKLPANVFCAVYKEEIPGFMAGYAVVKEGYKHLGFLGGMAVPAVIRFGYGFVQGANKAAEEMGITNEVTVEYVYGGQFFGDQTITAAMDTWCANLGVEVIFACGGGIWTSACEALQKTNGKLVGVDTDQTAQVSAYGENMCLTSAMKGLGATVNTVLTAVTHGNWSEYSGKLSSLGLVSATELDSNFVQLPTETWSMKNFTVDNYKALVSDIFNGKVQISDNIDVAPTCTIKFNQYPNIK